MQSKLRFLDPIIVIGIIISVALAIILVLIGQDEAISLLIGLVLTAITLLVDIIARIKESEKNIIQASTLETLLVKNPSLLSIVSQIAHDYEAIRKLQFDLFLQRADDALFECRDVVHGLAEERMIVDTRSKFTYGRKGINKAQKSVRAVAYANPSFWKTKYAKDYLETNKKAVERGVEFIRVWVQNRETLMEYKDVMEAQRAVGIKVLFATPDELPRRLLEDYMIVDDQVLVKLELMLDGHSKNENISINQIEVGRAISDFDLLLRHAHNFSSSFEEEILGNER